MSMNEDKTAVLLLRENPNQDSDPYSMEELRGLARAAGYRVLAEIRPAPGPGPPLPDRPGKDRRGV